MGEGWITCKGLGWMNLGLFPLFNVDNLGDVMVVGRDEGKKLREVRVRL